MKKLLTAVLFGLGTMTASAQVTSNTLPMDSVYQGRIVLPDFKGRDKSFANFRTRIRDEMRSGPNFAGHYSIVVIGCGTSCRFAIMGDVANGHVFDFPYGGEEHYDMSLNFNVKSNRIDVRWISEDDCLSDRLVWNGSAFKSEAKRRLGSRAFCEASS